MTKQQAIYQIPHGPYIDLDRIVQIDGPYYDEDEGTLVTIHYQLREQPVTLNLGRAIDVEYRFEEYFRHRLFLFADGSKSPEWEGSIAYHKAKAIFDDIIKAWNNRKEGI